MLHFTLYRTHDISLQQSPLSHMNRMAALRRLVGPSPSLSYTSLLPPTLLISCRGIASKLFVGGTLSLSTQWNPFFFFKLFYFYYLKTLIVIYVWPNMFRYLCTTRSGFYYYSNYDDNPFDVISVWILPFHLSTFFKKFSTLYGP